MWESWEEQKARERAERQEAADTPRLAKNIWLVWATDRPGLHYVCTANNAQSAEVCGKLALDYPRGGVSSVRVAGTVGEVINKAKTEDDE